VTDFPFVYLNHGPLDPESFDKVDAVWVAFAGPVSDEVVAEAAASCPAPLHGFFSADDSLLYCETGSDVYGSMVGFDYGRDEYGVSAEGAAAFSAEVEAWVLGIHERAPIAFVIGPSRPLLDEDDGIVDPWARWSEEQVGTVVVGWLERYADTHLDIPDEADEADEIDGTGPAIQAIDRYLLSTLRQHFSEELPTETVDRLDALGSRLGWE
jgi:hypothetical protein